MSAVSRAAHYWLANKRVGTDAKVSIIDLVNGIAAARRTGVGHYVTDAAEITVDGHTTLAAVWLCGGSTVDGFLVEDAEVPDCIGCRLAAAIPSGPVVYFAWGEDDELLYVGSSVKAPQRIRAHSTQTRWWPEVRRLTFEEYDREHEARRAEFEAIAERPGKYNREGRRVGSPTGTPAAHALLQMIEGGESA